MTNTPLVSIIIPTYNRAHLIGETLESLIAQTYTNWECIVVDDGSTDHIDEVLKNYCQKDKRIQYHYRPENRPKGANACRNYGFELSNGKYVNWFDDDDVMHSDKLFIQVKELEESEFNFSVCQTLVFEESIDHIIGLRNDAIVSAHSFYDYLTQKIVWLTPSALWNRKFLLNQDYLFDETLQAAQEWEFHSRILFKCRKYKANDTPLVFIRKHQESISYNTLSNQRLFHYYLARVKIYNLIKNEKHHANLALFFQNYFLGIYKRALASRYIDLYVGIYFKHIIFNKHLGVYYRLKLFIALFSYGILGKGYCFIKE